MNILPKKKWHVRTKENVARVRRDQRKAAEEERQLIERAQTAEHEFRLNVLRQNAGKRLFEFYGTKGQEQSQDDATPHADAPSAHVNFFAEMEAEERKNLGKGNKEYEEEKRKETREYESKVGIMKCLGEGSNELTKQSPWYERLPLRRSEASGKGESAKSVRTPAGVSHLKSAEKVKKKHTKEKRKKSEDRRKKHKRRRHSTSSSEAEADEPTSTTSTSRSQENSTIEKLRMERLRREREERQRAVALLTPAPEKSEASRSAAPRYSSQFNPEIARQNRPR